VFICGKFPSVLEVVVLLIKNGRVVDPSQNLDGPSQVLIRDGRIAKVAQRITAPEAEVLDATGLIVAPGFIDLHVHLREPGNEHAETIETGARAAAAGGFTSICCMPNTTPVNDNAAVTQFIVETAHRMAPVNVFPIGAISSRSQGEKLAEIGHMHRAGIVGLSDDGRPVMSSGLMRHAMEYSLAFGLVLIQHAEDLTLSHGGQMHEGAQSTRLGLRGIPGSSEDVMVARDILLAEQTGARYHVAHLSTARSLELVRDAKRRGLPVTCEVTPHHFTLCDEDIRDYDSNYKMKPPLRSRTDVEAMLEGLADGTVDAIATDHAPHPGSDKMQEFDQAPFGIIGLESALGLALERLYHSKRLTLSRLVSVFSCNPARVVSLKDRGTLAPGAHADVTLFSTERPWTLDANRSASRSRNTPFDGREFRGGQEVTIVGGKVVWKRA
jgi:dihydroorotase